MNEKDRLTIRLVIDIVLVSAALVAAILTTYELHQLRLELEWAQRVNFGVDRILRSHRGDFVLMALGALLVLLMTFLLMPWLRMLPRRPVGFQANSFLVSTIVTLMVLLIRCL